MSSHIRKSLKFRPMENSELHYIAEALIKILLHHNVTATIKTQLMLILELVLKLDSERGAHGLQLVQLFFQDLSDNAFKGFTEGSQISIEINGLFQVMCALFKCCVNPEYLLKMFQNVSSILSTFVSHTLINVLKRLLDQASSIASGSISKESEVTQSESVNEFTQIDRMNITEQLTIVKTWTVIHLEMIKKFKSEKFKQGLKLMVTNEEYGRLFSSILKFFVPPQTQNRMS
jgi:hypothetical protein